MLRVFFIASALAFSSCQTPSAVDQTLSAAELRVYCGAGDDRPWLQIDDPPSSSTTMRALADAHPTFPGSNPFGRETWYALPGGEIMLCRSDAAPRNSCAGPGQWWQFRLSGDSVTIAAQAGWYCIDD
jgi:hypothetical protein